MESRARVRRPRYRHHRRKLGVAQRRETAGDGGQDEGEDDRRAGTGTVNIAHDRGAGGRKDAGADGGPDAQRRQVPLGQRAAESAPFRDVVFAVGDGLPEK